jgi:diacylglycerol O-acyltransferase
MRPTRETTFAEPPRWTPRPIPTSTELLRDELQRQAELPLEVARGVARVLRAPVQRASQWAEGVAGAWHALRTGLQLPSDTPINRSIGPYRRCDWLSVDLNEAKAVKNRLGGTVNDVIIAAVTGGLRRFFERRHLNPDRLNFRATVPVNIRSRGERHMMGNRVSAWLMTLPLQERDPVQRLQQITEATAQLKRSHEASGIDLLTGMAAVFDPVLTLGLRITSLLHPYNLIITNVLGPPVPLYFFGARILEGYPIVPLFENQGLAVGSFSNAGRLFWGFNADWDLVPDLHDFVEAVALSFRELHDAATQGVYDVTQDNPPPHPTRHAVRGRG